jgi:putative aldouronate transport system substrate-binding protein
MKKWMVLIGCFVFGTAIGFAGGGTEGGGGASTRNSGGPPVFTIAVQMSAQYGDPAEMSIYKTLDSEAGTKANWMLVDSSAWGERKNIMINSGDYPEVFYGGGCFTADEIDRYGRQGLFIDLAPYIKQYAPNIQRLLDTDPMFKALVTSPSDGNKIYSMGKREGRIANGIQGSMFVYKPWLDKLGLKVPTTYLEFENMLRAFKANDLNGNGRPDEIPFSFNQKSSNNTLCQLMAMFGYGWQSIRRSFVEGDDGKLVFVPETENFRQSLIWLRKLFAEDLLDPEDYAGTANDGPERNSQPDVIVGSYIALGNNNTYVNDPERAKNYIHIPPMTGPTGEKHYMRDNRLMSSSGRGFILTNKAKPAQIPGIMKWLDQHFTETHRFEVTYGPIGETLQYDAKGMLVRIPTPAGMTDLEFRRHHTFDVLAYITEAEWGTKIEYLPEDGYRIPWVENHYWPVIQFFFYEYPNAEETAYMQAAGNEIETYIRTTVAKWLIEGGIEREWNSFQTNLKNMGSGEYIRICQAQYDRFYAIANVPVK